MQAVIISFDSLGANSLGCYGNEWVETPNWDRLAATGAIFDSHFADTTSELSGMAWSHDRHSLSPTGLVDRIALGSILKARGVATRLVVSGPSQHWQRVFQFDEVQSVEGRDDHDAKPDQTRFAEVVKAGVSAWNDVAFQHQPRLLWLHAPGPGTPPSGFDALYFEDFEERGQQISELSDEARSIHPAVYAGAVSLLDHWLGEFLDSLKEDLRGEPTLVIVMAARGHQWQTFNRSKMNAAQDRVEALGDQLARAPLVLKVIDDDRFKDFVCLRSKRLVQTCDLFPTLIDWFGLAGSIRSGPGRSWIRELTEEIPARAALTYGDGARRDAVRTEAWLCIRDIDSPLSTAGAETVPALTVSLYVEAG